MTIEYRHYVIEQEGNFLNLYRKHTSQTKDKETGEITDQTKEVLKNEGFGMQMKNVVKKIINLELEAKDVVVELNQFLAEYRKEREALENYLDSILEPKDYKLNGKVEAEWDND